MTTRQMVTSAQSVKRLRLFINSLALAPRRNCKSLHACSLCALPIAIGQDYRDRGYGRRAHEDCFLAVAEDLKAGDRKQGRA